MFKHWWESKELGMESWDKSWIMSSSSQKSVLDRRPQCKITSHKIEPMCFKMYLLLKAAESLGFRARVSVKYQSF